MIEERNGFECIDNDCMQCSKSLGNRKYLFIQAVWLDGENDYCVVSDIEDLTTMSLEDIESAKKPPANKAAKLSYLLLDVRGKRGRIKQCQCYIRVMQDAITNHYPLDKLKLELSKVTYVDYKGRTKYYNLALNILN